MNTSSEETKTQTKVEYPIFKDLFDYSVDPHFEWIDIDEMFKKLKQKERAGRLGINMQHILSKRKWMFIKDKQKAQSLSNIADYGVEKFLHIDKEIKIWGQLKYKYLDVRSIEVDTQGNEAYPKDHSIPEKADNTSTSVQFIAQRDIDEDDVLKRISNKLGQPIRKTHDPSDAGVGFQFMQVDNIEPDKIKAAFEEENCQVSDFKYIVDAEKESFNYIGRRFQICIRNIKQTPNLSIEKCLETFEREGYINFFSITFDVLQELKAKLLIGRNFMAENIIEAFEGLKEMCPVDRNKFEIIRTAVLLAGERKYVLQNVLDKAEPNISDPNNLMWLSIKAHLLKEKNKPTETLLQQANSKDIMEYLDLSLHWFWNSIVDKIVESRGGFTLEVGDLVFVDENAEKQVDEDEYSATIPVLSWIPNAYRLLVRPLTQEDIASNKYTVYDWVLPIPGGEVQLPENDSSKIIKQVVDASLFEGEQFKLKSIGRAVVRGSYRKVLQKPEKLKWKLQFYSDEKEPLALDNLAGLVQKYKNQNSASKNRSGDRKAEEGSNEDMWEDIMEIDGVQRPKDAKAALILEFFVPKKTSYLVAIRELLQSHTMFSDYVNEKMCTNKIRLSDMDKLHQFYKNLYNVHQTIPFSRRSRQSKETILLTSTAKTKPRPQTQIENAASDQKIVPKELRFAFNNGLESEPIWGEIKSFVKRFGKLKGVERQDAEVIMKQITAIVGKKKIKTMKHLIDTPYEPKGKKKQNTIIKESCDNLIEVFLKDVELREEFSDLFDDLQELLRTVTKPSARSSSKNYQPPPKRARRDYSPNDYASSSISLPPSLQVGYNEAQNTFYPISMQQSSNQIAQRYFPTNLERSMLLHQNEFNSSLRQNTFDSIPSQQYLNQQRYIPSDLNRFDSPRFSEHEKELRRESNGSTDRYPPPTQSLSSNSSNWRFADADDDRYRSDRQMQNFRSQERSPPNFDRANPNPYEIGSREHYSNQQDYIQRQRYNFDSGRQDYNQRDNMDYLDNESLNRSYQSHYDRRY